MIEHQSYTELDFKLTVKENKETMSYFSTDTMNVL